MVTRAPWHTALKAKVSGVSTDTALFSAHGFQLVHHYRVFKQCAAHASLCGTFMIDFRYFTTRACADAKWVAKRIRTSGTGSPTSPDSPVPLPRGFTRGRSDDESPACKAPWGCPRSCQEGRHRQQPRLSSRQRSTVPRRCPSYIRHPTVGEDRFCLFRCRSLASPTGTLRRLLLGHLRSRPSSIHHLLDPGSPPTASIWMISALIIPSRLILALRWCL